MSDADTIETPPKKRVKAARANQAKGADLRPNWDEPGQAIAVRRWFWCGSMPSIYASYISIGGTTFVRTHDTVMNRGAGGRSERIPRIGQIAHLSRTQIEAIKERLRYSVFRFTEAPFPVLTAGEGIEALEQRWRKGHPVRIMTGEEIQLRIKNNYPTELYERKEWDEPLADHVFAILVENQDRPRVGNFYPPPLSETGLEWPE